MPSGAPQSYVGTSKCFICHRPQTNTWSDTKHARAFTDLPEKYKNDSACLKCHVTAFGKAGGYASGTDKDLLMVGCEACHGPGAQHVDAAQRFVLASPGEEAKIEQEMRSSVVKTPPDTVCVACHTTQAHQKHPTFMSASAVKETNSIGAARHAASTIAACPAYTIAPVFVSSRYTTKTCGGCHYAQYKQWSTGGHSALAHMLPAKYMNDQSCLTCHPPANAAPKPSILAVDLHNQWIGVACESCHGPALKHVRFTKQFISSPPLGPKLEQSARNSIDKGKPAATCIQCHIRNGHKDHVAFDAK